MTTDKRCEGCGILMVGVNQRRRYCTTCLHDRHLKQNNASRKLARAAKKEAAKDAAPETVPETVPEPVKIPPKTPPKSIAQVVKEARARGLSYGQYVAQMREGR